MFEVKFIDNINNKIITLCTFRISTAAAMTGNTDFPDAAFIAMVDMQRMCRHGLNRCYKYPQHAEKITV